MKILGIESSCDETAAAVVEDGYRLLSNVVASSADLHVKYGGVVPEIAARSHIEVVLPVVQQALDDAQCSWNDIDAIAVTYGAGLGGSLLIGVLTARTLAIVHNKPLYGVNHVLAHVYANFLTEVADHPSLAHLQMARQQPVFPMMAIIVSGKHSQLVIFEDHFKYQLLGETQDDAIGEAFDKVAKMLGLPYPGGPSVSKLAESGDAQAYQMPKAKLTGQYDFSFSGVKTAVLRLAQAEIGESYNFPSSELAERLSEAQKRDIAASFQRTAVETMVDKAKIAYEEFGPVSVVIAGGVAANSELRRQLSAALPLPIEYPDFRLCTDNGAMVAALGCFHMKTDQPTADPYSLDIAPNLSM
jgi:N6-L-threonylcarbamoyladenine synthase